MPTALEALHQKALQKRPIALQHFFKAKLMPTTWVTAVYSPILAKAAKMAQTIW